MSDASTHIAAWQGAGLIDLPTADRLRAAETAISGSNVPDATAALSERPDEARSATTFGPGVAIAEAFGYLGVAFLMAAWSAFIARTASNAIDPEPIFGIGSGIAAVAFTALGVGLRRGDARRQRAAGVAFLVAVATAGGSAASFAIAAGIDWPTLGLVGAGAALTAAVAFRTYHATVLTQLAMLSALTGLAASLLEWFREALFPTADFADIGAVSPGPDPIVLVIGSAVWWLACAVLIGLIGLRESRLAETRGDPLGARRAGASRLWAGAVAVIGLGSAVTTSAFLTDGGFGRVLEPWIGDLGLLVLSVVLIERAFRREAAAFIYPAALALIVALSDFNFSYLADGTETGLFIEGVILLVAGFAADRLRRRVGRMKSAESTAPNPNEIEEVLPTQS